MGNQNSRTCSGPSWATIVSLFQSPCDPLCIHIMTWPFLSPSVPLCMSELPKSEPIPVLCFWFSATCNPTRCKTTCSWLRGKATVPYPLLVGSPHLPFPHPLYTCWCWMPRFLQPVVVPLPPLLACICSPCLVHGTLMMLLCFSGRSHLFPTITATLPCAFPAAL